MTLTVSDYYLKIYDTSGNYVATVGDFQYIAASKRVGRLGTLRAGFRGDHSIVAELGDRYRVDLYRRDPNNAIDFYVWWSGLYRSPRHEYRETHDFEMTAYDDKYWLHSRVVAYPAGTLNRSKFVATSPETIMKNIVRYNLVALSATTANGRIRDGVISGISCEATSGGGTPLDWYCFGDNVLDTLYKLSLVSGYDFDLVKTSQTAWEFRTYAGQLGTDRSATLTFSVDRGNLSAIKYAIDRKDEATVVIVGGEGIADEREFVVRTGDAYSAANDIEIFYNVSGQLTSGMQSSGDARLKETRAVEKFEFDVIQNEKTVYDRDYFLGDIAKFVNPFTAASTNRKIDAVLISVPSDGDETIEIETISA